MQLGQNRQMVLQFHEIYYEEFDRVKLLNPEFPLDMEGRDK